jgi:hypothetical protein
MSPMLANPTPRKYMFTSICPDTIQIELYITIEHARKDIYSSIGINTDNTTTSRSRSCNNKPAQLTFSSLLYHSFS